MVALIHELQATEADACGVFAHSFDHALLEEWIAIALLQLFIRRSRFQKILCRVVPLGWFLHIVSQNSLPQMFIKPVFKAW